MIHVIASLKIRPGTIDALMDVYTDFLPQVRAEQGCIAYTPAVDHDTDIPTQRKEPDVVTIVELWESIEAFRAHLIAPHVIAYRERIKGIVESVSIKVLDHVNGP